MRKAYGDKTVLDGIDLAVPAGTVFSLLDPNDGGKTTAEPVRLSLTADARSSRRGAPPPWCPATTA